MAYPKNSSVFKMSLGPGHVFTKSKIFEWGFCQGSTLVKRIDVVPTASVHLLLRVPFGELVSANNFSLFGLVDRAVPLCRVFV